MTNDPIQPVFFRYMQEPLAVAMTLAAVGVAFKEDGRALDTALHYFVHLSTNYRAGILLHNLKLHLRWKDWKDEKSHCESKIEEMEHWVNLLSDRWEQADQEEVILTWKRLFDLSEAELGTILSASAKAYAPVICEGDEIHSLIIGLITYVSKHPDDFKLESIMCSTHSLASRIRGIITGTLSLEKALYQLPPFTEQELDEFLINHLCGWTLSKEVKTGNYRIYGEIAILSVLKRAQESKDHSSS